jgi:hypothetical protein
LTCLFISPLNVPSLVKEKSRSTPPPHAAAHRRTPPPPPLLHAAALRRRQLAGHPLHATATGHTSPPHPWMPLLTTTVRPWLRHMNVNKPDLI